MLGPLRNTFLRYVSVVRWMLGDLLGAFGRNVAMILLTRLGGIVCLVFTLGVVTGYARVLEQSRQLEFGRWTIEPRESVPLLVIVGLVALLFMILGSALNFLSNRWGVRLRSDYGAYCAERVIRLAAETGHVGIPAHLDEPPDKFLRRLARRNATRCGRVAAQLITTVIPTAIVLILAVPVLFYINVWLTIAVVILLSVSLTVHFRINVRAARQLLEREEYSTQAAREYSLLLQQSTGQPVPGGSAVVAERFATSPITDSIRADTQYRSVSHNSQFLSDLFVALAIMTILVVLGGSILTKGTGWGELLIYLVACRYTLGQMRSLLSAIANSNRFYLQIREFFHFVENTYPSVSADSEPLPKKLTARVRDVSALPVTADEPEDAPGRQLVFWPQSNGESFERVDIRPGQRIGVLTTIPLNRLTLSQLFSALLGKSARHRRIRGVLANTAIVTRRSPLLVGETIADSLGLNPETGLKPIQPILEACGLWERVEPLLERSTESDPPLNGPVPRELDDELRLALLIASVMARGFRVVVLEQSALRKLSTPCRNALLDHLGHAIVFLVAYDPDELGEYGESVVTVMPNDVVIGLGDVQWLRACANSVRATLDAARGKETPDADAIDDALDEDDAADGEL